jgi:hypothetical protein
MLPMPKKWPSLVYPYKTRFHTAHQLYYLSHAAASCDLSAELATKHATCNL